MVNKKVLNINKLNLKTVHKYIKYMQVLSIS